MNRSTCISVLTATVAWVMAFGSLAQTAAADPPQSQENLLTTLRSNAPRQEKWNIAHQLARIGTGEAAPALATLLADDSLADLARCALEGIPGPAADEALRGALGQLKGRQLVGVINSVGERRDSKAVEPLSKLLADPDAEVASASIAALGRIGTAGAAKVLEEAATAAPAKNQRALYISLLQCADTLIARGQPGAAIALYDRIRAAQTVPEIRASAVCGAIIARGADSLTLLAEQLHSPDQAVFAVLLHLVQRQLPGTKVTQALATELGGLTDQRRPWLIQALGNRGDTAAVPALISAARSTDKSVRLAAIHALAQLGEPAAVPVLVESAASADPELAQAAQVSLASLPGRETDAAVLALFDSPAISRRLAAVQVAGLRRMADALPGLLKAAGDGESTLKIAALKVLGELGGESELPALLDLLAKSESAPEIGATEQALVSVCGRSDPADLSSGKIVSRMENSAPAVKCVLVRLLGLVSNADALRAVRTAVNDPNAEVQHSAVRTLAEWKDAAAAKDLLELARRLPNTTDKRLCLRGCIRLAGNPDLVDSQRLSICEQASALVEQDEEKKLMLGVLSGIVSPQSVAMMRPYLDHAATKEEACTAVLAVAEKLLQGNPAPANAAKLIGPLQKVVRVAATPELTSRAKTLIERGQKSLGTMGQSSGTVKFVMHRIGAFRSEACCVADFNRDGKLDVLGGENLYLAPEWKAVKIRTIKGSVDENGKGYRWDFANLALDADGDSLPDLISVDWFEKRAVWLRNTGAAGGEWPLAVIEENGNFESADLWDIDRDGQALEILPHVQRTVWYEVVKGPDGKRTFAIHVVSDKLLPFGGGVGDLNGDGRPDIIRPAAWFAAPTDPRNGKWIEHPIALGHKEAGKADHTAQVLVYDVNGDGLNDIICSSAHEYGIFWCEQIREGGEIRFKPHLIDDSWTQAHSLALGDLDGDGSLELVAGKRFMAHNGGDPEETAPLCVYYYKLHPKPTLTWTKHTVSYNEGIGSGMNICLVDLDGDGDLDIVVTGKWGGPVWFESKLK